MNAARPAGGAPPIRVPQDVIDELLARVDLLDLVCESIRVHSDAQIHRAACPFHTGPGDPMSLDIDADTNRLRCKVCEFQGSAIGWLMYHDGLTFQDAILELARRTTIDVGPWIDASRSVHARRLSLALLDQVDQVYVDALAAHPAPAAYLARRGISPGTAARYRIGYAPPSIGVFDGALVRHHRRLWQQGLLIRKTDGEYRPRFSDRLTFPIRTDVGETIGFGARTLRDGTGVKYLNSPGSPLFSKRHAVYGLHEALQSWSDPSDTPFLLVEGYLDVLALAEHGFPRAVATLGTAVSEHQVRQISRHTNTLIACFDGDAGGDRAQARLIEIALPLLDDHQHITIARLPAGEDPASLLLASGRQPMMRVLDQARPIEEVLLAQLGTGLDLDAISGKAALAARARPVLKTVRSHALSARLIARLEHVIGLSWSED